MKGTQTTCTHAPGLAYASSLIVAAIMAVVSAVGLGLGAELYRTDTHQATGVSAATAGLLVPGFLIHDGINLVAGLPILLGSLWLARRGIFIGVLLLPGALYYVLYTYTTYIVGSPFSVLFLAYVALVTLSAYSIIALVASIDGGEVRQRLAGVVPPKGVGVIMIVLALLTLAQDAGGALATGLAASEPIAPAGRHIWTADLVLQVPAMFIGGLLLWKLKPLGFVISAGLLFQYGMTPVALAIMMGLQPVLNSSLPDIGTIVALLMFAAFSFGPLAFFVRGMAASHATSMSIRLASSGNIDPLVAIADHE